MADDFTPEGKAEQSATNGEIVLITYAEQHSDTEDEQTALADLLTDLLHYCSRDLAPDFDAALVSALNHHAAEKD